MLLEALIHASSAVLRKYDKKKPQPISIKSSFTQLQYFTKFKSPQLNSQITHIPDLCCIHLHI